MKFIICLIILAACTEALPWSRDVRSAEGCDDPEEVSVAAGQVLEGALVTHSKSDGLYQNNACQEWNIVTVANECIVITVGDGGFNTESGYDFVVFKDSISTSETQREGFVQNGILFTSETNNVNVRFSSDESGRRSGFSLDITSTSCADLINPEEDESNEGCNVEKVVVRAGEDLEGAIVSHNEIDGLYQNNVCKEWNIITVDNECLVITVGRGGFHTESGYDFVLFKDSNSPSVTRKEASVSGLLFRSETNSVNVRFTSDESMRKRGFTLNIRSGPCHSVQEVVVAPGDVLEGAIVSYTQSDGLYPNRALEDWIITTEENQCIVITVGDGGFNTEKEFDVVVFKDSNNGSETQGDGEHPTGHVLFTSETNSVDVTFTSDGTVGRSGFTLDVRSTDCTD